ncbi:hypothetical protein RRF57_011526 [Xylaria bambusicola]|uniref:Uncharacterized protein n=1 Tax=Xylaria bambusicola TaxID=326684 RepID=A0AAN7UWW4_9PEZI
MKSSEIIRLKVLPWEGFEIDSEQVASNTEERGIASQVPMGQAPIPCQQLESNSTFAYSPEMGVMTGPSYANRLTAATCLNQPESGSPGSMDSAESMNMLRSAAAQLLDLGCAPPPVDSGVVDHGCPSIQEDGDCFFQPQRRTGAATTSLMNTHLSEHSPCDDGIFLPGSTYLELHSTLRNRIFDTARSAHSSRAPTPGVAIGADDTVDSYAEVNYEVPLPQQEIPPSPPASTPLLAELERQDEFHLWKNWVDEIAPWVSHPRIHSSCNSLMLFLILIVILKLDKFDNNCHFGRTLPVMARNHRHLRCSMLALSARQQERKYPKRRSSASLALYQEAVHQLIPQLETRSTAVVASCVVLCVLEMMSCKHAVLVSNRL